MKATILVVLIELLTFSFVGYCVSKIYYETEVKEAYALGFKEGAASVVAAPVKEQCTTRQAVLWWTNTTDMRRAKRQLCGR